MKRDKMIILEGLVDQFNTKYFDNPQRIVFVYDNDYYSADFLQANYYGRYKDDTANAKQYETDFKLDWVNLKKDFGAFSNFDPHPRKEISLKPVVFFKKMVDFLDKKASVDQYFLTEVKADEPIYNVKSLSNNFTLDFLLLPIDAEFTPISLVSSEIDYSNW